MTLWNASWDLFHRLADLAVLRRLLVLIVLALSEPNNLWVDLEAAEASAIWRQAFLDEVRPKDRRQSKTNVVTESRAESAGAWVWYPVALSENGATGDGVRKLFEARIGVESLGWSSLTTRLALV